MELKLAKDEQIIKSWDYAVSGKMLQSKAKKIQSNLTVTNKRIIATQYNDIYLKRDELPVAAVKSISGEYRTARKFWPMVKLIIGIPLCIVLVGIKIVKSALDQLRSADFDLVIITSGEEGSSLGLGAFSHAAPTKGGIFAKLKGLFKTKVLVSKELSKEILDELGAIVIDCKNA